MSFPHSNRAGTLASSAAKHTKGNVHLRTAGLKGRQQLDNLPGYRVSLSRIFQLLDESRLLKRIPEDQPHLAYAVGIFQNLLPDLLPQVLALWKRAGTQPPP